MEATRRAQRIAMLAEKERSRPAVGIVIPPAPTATSSETRISSKPRIPIQRKDLGEILRSRGLDFYKGECSPARGRDERSEQERASRPCFQEPYKSPRPTNWNDPRRTRKVNGRWKKFHKKLLREKTPTEIFLYPLLCDQDLAPHGLPWGFQDIFLRRFPDFRLPLCKLILEVDGSSHNGRYDKDLARDRKLADHGYMVLRFPNWLARKCVSGLLAELEDLILERHLLKERDDYRATTCYGSVRHYSALPDRKPRHLGSSAWLCAQK